MALPGHRRTKKGEKMRTAAKRLKIRVLSNCPNCNATVRPHHACTSCGTYRNRKVIA